MITMTETFAFLLNMNRDVKVNHINSFQDGKVDSAGGEPESKDNNGETITTQPLNTKETEES